MSPSVIDILLTYRAEFAAGLWVTVELALAIWTLGLLFGSLLGVAGHRWPRSIGIPSRTASFVLGGIPVLVFLFWLHYPLQASLGVVIKPMYTAIAALSIVNALLVADIIRAALTDFPAQYVQAGLVCGLSQSEITRRIQLPLLFRQVLPSLLFLQVSMLQATLFASLISVDEIFRIAQRINSEVYRPVQIYSALAVFFLLVCLPINGAGLWLRSRYTRDLSER